MVVINTFVLPTSRIIVQQPDTRAFFNDKEIGKGTIYIAESAFSWCDSTKQLGFTIQYPNISLHAVRRDPVPSLYIMVDHIMGLPEGLAPPGGSGEQEQGGAGGDGDDDDDERGEEDEGQDVTEMYFAPPLDTMLHRMFLAMNQCQAMNPDERAAGGPDSDEYEDADDQEEYYQVIDPDNFHPLHSLEQIMQSANELQALQLGTSNGHGGNSAEEGDMEYDPEQFADD